LINGLIPKALLNDHKGENMNRNELFLAIEEFHYEVTQTVWKKNADYTADNADVFDNFKFVEQQGITDTLTGMLVRLSDKYKRLISLLGKDHEPLVDESTEDTLLDLAGYTALMFAYLKQRKTPPPLPDTLSESSKEVWEHFTNEGYT
jgi:hypothetical protein